MGSIFQVVFVEHLRKFVTVSISTTSKRAPDASVTIHASTDESAANYVSIALNTEHC